MGDPPSVYISGMPWRFCLHILRILVTSSVSNVYRGRSGGPYSEERYSANQSVDIYDQVCPSTLATYLSFRSTHISCDHPKTTSISLVRAVSHAAFPIIPSPLRYEILS